MFWKFSVNSEFSILYYLARFLTLVTERSWPIMLRWKHHFVGSKSLADGKKNSDKLLAGCKLSNLFHVYKRKFCPKKIWETKSQEPRSMWTVALKVIEEENPAKNPATSVAQTWAWSPTSDWIQYRQVFSPFRGLCCKPRAASYQ